MFAKKHRTSRSFTLTLSAKFSLNSSSTWQCNDQRKRSAIGISTLLSCCSNSKTLDIHPVVPGAAILFQPDTARPAGSILGYFYLLPRVGYESIRHRVRVWIKALLDWRRTHGYHSSDWCERTVISMGFIAARLISSLPVKKFIFRQNKRRVGRTCCWTDWVAGGWSQGCLMNAGCIIIDPLSILRQGKYFDSEKSGGKQVGLFLCGYYRYERLAAPFQNWMFPDLWITCSKSSLAREAIYKRYETKICEIFFVI